MGTGAGHSDPWSDWSAVRQEKDSELRFFSTNLDFPDMETDVASVRDV